MSAKRDKTIVIHSKVSYGYVGSSTTALVLQTGRQDAVAVPTVLYSNRLGLATVGGGLVPDALFADILKGILELDIFHEVSSIITGFIGSAEQVRITAEFVEQVKKRQPGVTYLCDPVMGDVDGFYVRPGVPEAIIGLLVPRADVLTPNYFELQQLTGRAFASLADMEAFLRAQQSFPNQQLVATSCLFGDTPPGWIDIVSYAGGEIHLERTPRIAVDPPGTGELFAAHLHLRMLRGAGFREAVRESAQVMHAVLTRIRDQNRHEMALGDILYSTALTAV